MRWWHWVGIGLTLWILVVYGIMSLHIRFGKHHEKVNPEDEPLGI